MGSRESNGGFLIVKIYKKCMNSIRASVISSFGAMDIVMKLLGSVHYQITMSLLGKKTQRTKQDGCAQKYVLSKRL